MVPWRPIKPPADGMRLAATHPAAPACSPGALVVTTGGLPGGAMGTLYIPLTVHNHGSSACTLHDKNLRVDWRSGHHTHVINGTTRLLLPGGSQKYRMGFAGACVSLPSSLPITFTPASASLGDNPVTTRDGKGIPDTVSSCSNAFLDPVEAPSAEDAGTGPYSQLTR